MLSLIFDKMLEKESIPPYLGRLTFYGINIYSSKVEWKSEMDRVAWYLCTLHTLLR
jgi:hypothetical protein